MYQPKTGASCYCKRGIQRDNCSNCEGTGQVIDFAAIRARRTYRAQCARDAQAMNYGSKSYWDSLEESSIEHYNKGISDALTRTLSEALQGNEGD